MVLHLPETRLSRIIDPAIVRVGAWASWFWLALMVIIVSNVVLRYAFGEGRVEFEEIQWHLYSCGFLLGLSYAYQTDSHIRVDVLHEYMSVRTRAWIELYGNILLLLPFLMVVIYFSIPFVTTSFALGEVSQSPGGLAYRWAVKAMIPIGFCLLLLALISRLSRLWTLLFFEAKECDGGE